MFFMCFTISIAMTQGGPIYIVDDDDAVRDSLRTLLEIGFSGVRAFDSCREFLDAYDRNGNGCLILDIHLPDMTGFELMERLAADDARLPTILVTGRSDDGIRARAATLGAVALLDKPVDYDDLIAALARALGDAASA
jgi:FixJ family two-component response regulator